MKRQPSSSHNHHHAQPLFDLQYQQQYEHEPLHIMEHEERQQPFRAGMKRSRPQPATDALNKLLGSTTTTTTNSSMAPTSSLSLLPNPFLAESHLSLLMKKTRQHRRRQRQERRRQKQQQQRASRTYQIEASATALPSSFTTTIIPPIPRMIDVEDGNRHLAPYAAVWAVASPALSLPAAAAAASPPSFGSSSCTKVGNSPTALPSSRSSASLSSSASSSGGSKTSKASRGDDMFNFPMIEWCGNDDAAAATTSTTLQHLRNENTTARSSLSDFLTSATTNDKIDRVINFDPYNLGGPARHHHAAEEDDLLLLPPSAKRQRVFGQGHHSSSSLTLNGVCSPKKKNEATSTMKRSKCITNNLALLATEEDQQNSSNNGNNRIGLMTATASSGGRGSSSKQNNQHLKGLNNRLEDIQLDDELLDIYPSATFETSISIIA